MDEHFKNEKKKKQQTYNLSYVFFFLLQHKYFIYSTTGIYFNPTMY